MLAFIRLVDPIIELRLTSAYVPTGYGRAKGTDFEGFAIVLHTTTQVALGLLLDSSLVMLECRAGLFVQTPVMVLPLGAQA